MVILQSCTAKIHGIDVFEEMNDTKIISTLEPIRSTSKLPSSTVTKVTLPTTTTEVPITNRTTLKTTSDTTHNFTDAINDTIIHVKPETSTVTPKTSIEEIPEETNITNKEDTNSSKIVILVVVIIIAITFAAIVIYIACYALKQRRKSTKTPLPKKTSSFKSLGPFKNARKSMSSLSGESSSIKSTPSK